MTKQIERPVVKDLSGLIQIHLSVLLIAGTALFLKLLALPAQYRTGMRAPIGVPILLLLGLYWKSSFHLKRRVGLIKNSVNPLASPAHGCSTDNP